jgi:tRNA (guanine37-N1)-methyltransferase
LKFDVVTLFPGMLLGPLQDSILARARRAGRIAVRAHDLRRWGTGAHRQVDDAPYGGGSGMILKAEPFFGAVGWIRERYPSADDRVVLLSPQGPRLDHATAKRLASLDRLILLCGHYEGVDERVRTALADEELSVGDVVLTGGELPALVLIDAVSRLLPGVLGAEDAAANDSFARGGLDFPQYTRPASYRGLGVPDVLLSGNHREVEEWRSSKAAEATRSKRPDLLAGAGGSAAKKRARE